MSVCEILSLFLIRHPVYIVATLELIVLSFLIIEEGKDAHGDSRSIAITQSSRMAKTSGALIKSSLRS
jgi:hypothetical protein